MNKLTSDPEISVPTTSVPEDVKVINLTPHTVDIFVGDTKVKSFPPESDPVRIETEDTYAGHVNDVPVVVQEVGDISIPPPVEGALYLVSSFVLEKSERLDLISPDTRPGSVVRNEEGRIEGVRRFRSNALFE